MFIFSVKRISFCFFLSVLLLGRVKAQKNPNRSWTRFNGSFTFFIDLLNLMRYCLLGWNGSKKKSAKWSRVKQFTGFDTAVLFLYLQFYYYYYYYLYLFHHGFCFITLGEPYSRTSQAASRAKGRAGAHVKVAATATVSCFCNRYILLLVLDFHLIFQVWGIRYFWVFSRCFQFWKGSSSKAHKISIDMISAV